MYYTKYRPQKFSEISRPNEAADALATQVVSGKTVHAYLFVGPRGTGKTSTARILAKALNCPNLDKNGDPCDECPACEAIKKGSYLDLTEIDAASNRGIDDIRELKNKVKLAPTIGKNKIYIIDEVHMLTTEAFNALLKTLEEPPKNSIFILCTTEFHKVPETIKSRCQVFKFKRATTRQIVTKLERIAEEEAITIDKADLEKIARASLGGFRDAETMLQQVSEGEVTVESLLNVGSREKYLEFCTFLVKADAASALKLVDKIFDEGADLYVWVGELLKHFRDLLMIKSGMPFDFTDLTDELKTDVKDQAIATNLSWLLNSLEVFSDAQVKVKTSFLPQLPVEIAVVKICDPLAQASANMAYVSNGPDTPNTPGIGKPQKLNKPTESAFAQKDNASSYEIASDKSDMVGIKPSPILAEDTDAEEIRIDMTIVEEKWSAVMARVDGINRSILGLLKAGKPVAMEGKFLVLEVSYAFHKERLEAPKNRDIVEQVLHDIYNADLKVKCRLSMEKPKKLQAKEVGVLTDYNVVMIDKNAVLDMLDGGLPL